MKSNGSGSAGKKGSGKRGFEERGDTSAQCLHRTIVVCAVALVGVLAFAFSPRPKSAPVASVAPKSEAKVATSSFDRQFLSTRNR